MKFIDNWTKQTQKLEEKPTKSEFVYNGVLIKAWRDEVVLPDGKDSVREYIRHPGAAAVIPVYENGDIMLVGQYRYPLRKSFLEIPAGKLDPGEDARTTAIRELEEEAGLLSRNVEKIGHFHPVIGYSDEVIHLYVGWGLSHVKKNTDDDEFLTWHRLHFREALELIDCNEITDSKTVIGLLRTWRWWEKNGPFNI